MAKSSALQRREKIIRLLLEQQATKVEQLTRLLGVSEWTIRRDLDSLEEQQLVERYYGGVRLTSSPDSRYFLPPDDASHEGAMLEAKRRIARVVLRFIRPGQQLALGAGTTTSQVAQALSECHHSCRVVTNALDIAQTLARAPPIEVTCTGGDVHGDYSTLVGPVTERALKMHFFDLAVIGASGIALPQGLTVNSQLNAVPLIMMLEHANKVIVAVDHNKFGKVSFARLASFDDIDVVITDRDPGQLFREELMQSGVDLVIASL